MNNNFRPLCEDEIKSKKTEVLKKLNIFLKKQEPYVLKEISERKKQLREKAIKTFGGIKLKNLTYTQSPEKLTSDQSILLHEKQRDFLNTNKDEILNVLKLVNTVTGKLSTEKEIEKIMFDMTNINTPLESVWFNTTKFIKKLTYPIALVFAVVGSIEFYKLGNYVFDPKSDLIELSIYIGMISGFAMGGFSAEMIHQTSNITKRFEEIKSHNNIFVKAYIYNDNYCKNMLENKI